MKKTVYLWSYMRPEMTSQAISKIMAWEELKCLVVIIDGLREGADDRETLWRTKTIEVCEASMAKDSRVNLWKYEDNIGNTNHILRVQLRAINFDEYGIWLEEDIDLDLSAYSNIQNQFLNAHYPVLLTGYSQCNHNKELSLKNTLFVPLWGQTINGFLVEEIQKVWADKRFEKKIVEDVFRQVFHEDLANRKRYFNRVLDYWVNYSEWGIKSSRRWDALANYSLWKSGSFAFSTTERIAHDTSYLDFRGMNQRQKPGITPTHTPNFISVERFTFCIDCERLGSRQEPSELSRIQKSITYRANKVADILKRRGGDSQWYAD